MSDIAGMLYIEAEFDKHGAQTNQVTPPTGVTDALVISHGWNNSAREARTLYRNFFESFAAVARPGDVPGRTFVVVGVLWPSKAFDESVAVSGVPDAAEGAMSLAAAAEGSQQALEQKLARMKEIFTEPSQQRALDVAKTLLPDLEDRASARREFVNTIRGLLDPTSANKEDASDSFFTDDGNELMQTLKVDEEDLAEDVSGPGGGAAFTFGRARASAVEGAAGLKEMLSGFKASAMNVLNFTTYYEMKTRAGTVGKNGVAPLVDRFAAGVERIHLIGHSFGGRVVTAAAANSTTDKIRSMTLLQTAFSHNGFSRSMNGFFRAVVDRQRVKGPIVVTHTKNDKAVGVAYPLASRISGDQAAALGDENDVFGGLGRNGAQRMEAGETVIGRLLPVGSAYAFQAGKFFNLEASEFIKGHSDVTGHEVAHATRWAIGGF